MTDLYQLGKGTKMLSRQQIIRKIGEFPAQDYQYCQIKNLGFGAK